MPSRLDHEIQEQRLANQSALPHSAIYENHRRHLTRELLRGAASDQAESICLLGAGNCHDVELSTLLQSYGEVHLVDLDASALQQAQDRLAENQRPHVHCHAPVDLSGMLAHVERWGRFQLTPEELMAHPDTVARALASRLGGPFDVVASVCVLTQMQLAVLNALGEHHRLFQAIRHTLSVTHLRTLASLTRPGGRVVFASDLVASDHLALPLDASDADLQSLFDEAVRNGNAMYVAHPGVLGAILRDDPVLARDLSAEPVRDLWLWQQGPARTFLVYAQHLARRRP